MLAIQEKIAAGDSSAAENLLSEALKDHPDDGGLCNLQGVIHAQRGDYAAAESDFQKAIRLSPGLSGAYLNLGRIYEMHPGAEGGAKAERLYRELLKTQPQVTEARFQLAKVLEWRGAFRESRTELDRLPPAEREKARALALACADAAGSGRAAHASELAEKALRAPDLEERDVLAILPALEAHNGDAVIVQLLEGLHARGGISAESLERLGAAYQKLNKLSGARKAYEDAQRQEPAKLDLLLILARIAHGQHDLEGALGYLAHARDLAPKNAQVHFLFGIVAEEMDLPLEARNSLRTALKLDPANAYYNYAMGSVELQEKEVSLAIPYFQKYIALRPEDPRGKFALGVAEFGSGNYDAAEKDLAEAAQKKETAAGAEYFLGRIAKIDADWNSAAEHQRRSIEADPAYADSHAELALANMRLGNIEVARRELDRALAIDKDSYTANQNLLALYERTKDPRTVRQRQRVSELETKRSRKQELMLRRIEVRPY